MKPEFDRLDSGEEQLRLPIDLNESRLQKKDEQALGSIPGPADGELYFNPLLDYPRNAPCICDSGRKFKKCHGPLIQARITKSEADEIIESINEFRTRSEA